MYQYVMDGSVCRAGSNSVGIRRAIKIRDDGVGRAEISALHALRVSYKNARIENQAVKSLIVPL